jgi:hypothetical protein
LLVALGQVTVLPDGHVVVETPKPGTPNAKYLLDLQLFGRLRVGVLFRVLKKEKKSKAHQSACDGSRRASGK